VNTGETDMTNVLVIKPESLYSGTAYCSPITLALEETPINFYPIPHHLTYCLNEFDTHRCGVKIHKVNSELWGFYSPEGDNWSVAKAYVANGMLPPATILIDLDLIFVNEADNQVVDAFMRSTSIVKSIIEVNEIQLKRESSVARYVSY
jgi:hypothetical protein